MQERPKLIDFSRSYCFYKIEVLALPHQKHGTSQSIMKFKNKLESAEIGLDNSNLSAIC